MSCPLEVLYDPLKVITHPTTSSSLCPVAHNDPSLRQEKIYLSAYNEKGLSVHVARHVEEHSLPFPKFLFCPPLFCLCPG